jgi:hypothetical protein
MLWRVRNSRGRPENAPAAFIHPYQPIVAKQFPEMTGSLHRQYRKEKLIERYGADMRLPDLREEIAQCRHLGCTMPGWCESCTGSNAGDGRDVLKRTSIVVF